MKRLCIVPVTLLAALGLLISVIPAAGQDAPAADKNAPAADKAAPAPDADKTTAPAADQDVPPVATNLTPEQQKALDKQAAAKEKKEAAAQAVTDKKKARNSKNDTDAIGSRDVDKGSVNFYSLEKEIAMGKQLAQEVERQAKIIDDPIIAEYVNRVGQNLVRNSTRRCPSPLRSWTRKKSTLSRCRAGSFSSIPAFS